MAKRLSNGATNRVVLERVAYEPAAWEATLRQYRDAEVFHSPEWLSFLSTSHGAETVIAIVRDHGQPIGHFVGAIVRRYGVKILGSPLRGWGTESMGFLLDAGADRRAAAEALIPFAFEELGCSHVELSDRWLTGEQMAGSGFLVEVGRTFLVDLERSEQEILAGMRSRTRTYIRQAERKGLLVEPVTAQSFSDEYYAQLVEVFARQGLRPTYGVQRVSDLIRALRPTGQVVTLRITSPDGRSLGTVVVVGRNRTAIMWGAAFDRAMADDHSNELLHWEAMRRWRAAGASLYDMGGGGDYKAKYGGVETPVYHFYRSRFPAMTTARNAVRRLVKSRQRLVRGRGAAMSLMPTALDRFGPSGAVLLGTQLAERETPHGFARPLEQP